MGRLSLSGLLNALDGVGAQEGRILFATTNKYEALDAALCRPGRMDLHIEFRLTSKFQARQLFSRFYLPAQNPETMMEEVDNEGSVDSGYDSVGEEAQSSGASSVPESEKPTYNGTSHQTRAPKLKRQQIGELAVRFADAIPEREISMASLQVGSIQLHFLCLLLNARAGIFDDVQNPTFRGRRGGEGVGGEGAERAARKGEQGEAEGGREGQGGGSGEGEGGGEG